MIVSFGIFEAGEGNTAEALTNAIEDIKNAEIENAIELKDASCNVGYHIDS